MKTQELLLKIDNKDFPYLKDISKEIINRYNVKEVDYHDKSEGKKIELKFNLPIIKDLSIKRNTEITKLSLQLRVIDSIDHKIALRIEPLIYSSFNDSYFYMEMNRKIKLTHRGSNFDRVDTTELVKQLPTEKELRSLLDSFILKYEAIKEKYISEKTLNSLVNSITDSYLRNMFERKLGCSKFFSVKEELVLEHVTTSKSSSSDKRISLENFYNCYAECHRSAPIDGLKRSNKKIEKILEKYF